jgi:hypothetical protein
MRSYTFFYRSIGEKKFWNGADLLALVLVVMLVVLLVVRLTMPFAMVFVIFDFR